MYSKRPRTHKPYSQLFNCTQNECILHSRPYKPCSSVVQLHVEMHGFQTAQSSPEHPKATQISPEQPKAAQSSPKQPRAAHSSPEQPKAAQGSPKHAFARISKHFYDTFASPSYNGTCFTVLSKGAMQLVIIFAINLCIFTTL